MNDLPTIQDTFIEIYHQQPWEIRDTERYQLTVQKFCQKYHLCPPYTTYHSFKNALTKLRQKQTKP